MWPGDRSSDTCSPTAAAETSAWYLPALHLLVLVVYEVLAVRAMRRGRLRATGLYSLCYVLLVPVSYAACRHLDLGPYRATITVITILITAFSYYLLPPVALPVSGRAVLITGCDTGLGQYLARELSGAGFRVFAGCLDAEGAGAQQLGEVSTAGAMRNGLGVTSAPGAPGAITVVQMDVCSAPQVERCVQSVQRTLDSEGRRLWAVINNAGVWTVSEVEWMSMSELRRTMDVNLSGAVRVTQAFLPLVRRGRGRLVFMSSLVRSLYASPTSAYAISKRALDAFVDVLRVEMRAWQVPVSSVVPGGFDTGAQSPARCAEVWEAVRAGATDHVLHTYGLPYMRHVFANGTSAPKSRDLSPVLRAVTAALLEAAPRVTYPCGTLAGTISLLLRYLPGDEWRDALVARLQYRHGAALLPAAKSRTAPAAATAATGEN